MSWHNHISWCNCNRTFRFWMIHRWHSLDACIFRIVPWHVRTIDSIGCFVVRLRRRGLQLPPLDRWSMCRYRWRYRGPIVPRHYLMYRYSIRLYWNPWRETRPNIVRVVHFRFQLVKWAGRGEAVVERGRSKNRRSHDYLPDRGCSASVLGGGLAWCSFLVSWFGWVEIYWWMEDFGYWQRWGFMRSVIICVIYEQEGTWTLRTKSTQS
jgi:hypothetical protein